MESNAPDISSAQANNFFLSTHTDEELKEVYREHSEHQGLCGTRTDCPPYLLYHKPGQKYFFLKASQESKKL